MFFQSSPTLLSLYPAPYTATHCTLGLCSLFIDNARSMHWSCTISPIFQINLFSTLSLTLPLCEHHNHILFYFVWLLLWHISDRECSLFDRYPTMIEGEKREFIFCSLKCIWIALIEPCTRHQHKLNTKPDSVVGSWLMPQVVCACAPVL